ncbi:HAMP domain-containing sensor histidine kinase [Clostridium sp. OS1-26]|uniref:HAMP domain-containing sensor histidine kinase n=1 Tax=Clostridium sp. OS1-26 TaxID=3070681 RepID=UPI0027DF58C2|nr:HAMP domain-containing sensor histidine kinase [Clostridium sp. OS1-26]WML37328.1 HAMP domain-containing sensor histidine kinase [Clostridium sp. OS1-26]
MKKKLTMQFLFWNVIILFLIQFVFFAVNILSIHKGMAFSKNFYNFTFSTTEFSQKYRDKLINGAQSFNLNEDDIKVLTENNIWIQVLDSYSREVYNVNKPKEIPTEYLAGELVDYTVNGWKMPKPSTIHTEVFNKGGQKYSLILGFPIEKISQRVLVFNEETIKFYFALIILAFVLTILMGYLFSRKLATPIADIIDNIKILSQGKFKIKSIKKIGVYTEVNENINKLAKKLEENEEERKSVDKLKEEWIANIAHDLKTPLSSVNGYAQLLLNDDYHLEERDIKRYGEIIINKTEYIQELINDLSLIYKFKNKVIPLKLERENIVDIARETVIDILNNPVYSDINININYDSEEIYICCDKKYIKRALCNFLFNAIVHNPKDTIVDINISENSGVIIEITDNGNGIKEEELKSLFHRYYRATNTGESHKGSGLGMAISKEIIEVHNGEIEVFSKVSEGTKIVIKL